MNDKSHIVESSAATDVIQDSYESMATVLSPVEEPEPEKMKRICTLLGEEDFNQFKIDELDDADDALYVY